VVKNLVTTWKKSAKQRVRRLAEFRGIRHQPLNNYQNSVRRVYDGPRGAVIKYTSKLSLHEPLMGKLFRSRFDASIFDTILDVGSGAGQIIRHLLATTTTSRIIGFDLSAEMLRRAQERLKSDRPIFVAANMVSVPFKDASFDCVTCGYALEHLPDPKPGLAEFARVLKPGGTILLVATEDSLSGFLTSKTFKCRTYSRTELKNACKDVGLEWSKELWFTRFHAALRLGGILVELRKPLPSEKRATPLQASA